MEKKLLTIKETCEYLGIGETKSRELIRENNGFGLQIGNRWYADKNKLDKWLDKMAMYLPEGSLWCYTMKKYSYTNSL